MVNVVAAAFDQFDRIDAAGFDLDRTAGSELRQVDHVADEVAITEKLARYRLQGAAYAAAVEAATSELVHRMVFVFLGDDGAIEVDLPDLRAAVEQVRATTDELAEASATESITDID